jgi:hypothetical protein
VRFPGNNSTLESLTNDSQLVLTENKSFSLSLSISEINSALEMIITFLIVPFDSKEEDD